MPPFEYQHYRNPYVGSIAELMARQGDIRAQAAQQIGSAQANAALQRGQVYGNAAQQIGQSITAIPQQMQAQRALQQESELRGLQLQAAKRQESDVAAFDAAFKNPDRDSILNALPGHLKPTVMKQFTDADSSAAKLQKLQSDLQQANTEYLAGLGASVAEHGYDLTAAGLALQHARNTYERSGNGAMVQQIDAIAQQISSDPNKLKSIVDGVIQQSPERAKMLQTATHQAAQLEQSKTVSEETARHNAAMEALQTVTSGRQAKEAEERARHNAAMERLRAAQISQNEAAPELSPEALQLTAHQYAMTGQLPPMGMGGKGAKVRTDIINKAAEIYKGLDLPTQAAAYKANQESLKKLVGQRDAIGAFEETALKNLDVFINAAGKIADTGSPLLNKPLRAITGTGLGSAEQTAFETARRTVVPEFAKILANPGLSGQLSDSARHEVEEVVKGNATMAQILAAARVLKTDTANRRTSYDDQIKAIQQRIATPPGGKAPVTPDTVWELGPDGQLRKKGG